MTQKNSKTNPEEHQTPEPKTADGRLKNYPRLTKHIDSTILSIIVMITKSRRQISANFKNIQIKKIQMNIMVYVFISKK